MLDSTPEELTHVEELLNEAKFEEAFEILSNFEKNKELNPEELLLVFLLKGQIHGSLLQYKEAIEIGEQAYQISQKLGMIPETIEALFLMSYILSQGKFEKGISLILKAEKLLDSLSIESNLKLLRLKSNILGQKAWFYFFTSDLDKALETATQHRNIQDELESKSGIAFNNVLQGYIYWSQGSLDVALEFAEQALVIHKQLNFQLGIAGCLNLLGFINAFKGNLNNSIDYCQKSLEINKLENRNRLDALGLLAGIYLEKGDPAQAIEFYNQAIRVAQKLKITDRIASFLSSTGFAYMMMGDSDRAIEDLKRSLTILENGTALATLIPIYLNNDFHAKAEEYLIQLQEFKDKFKTELNDQLYLISKALMLKSSDRMRDHVEAENLLKQIIERDNIMPRIHVEALFYLCDLLLEELSLFNNMELLDEIDTIIHRVSYLSEKEHSYWRLIRAKLLQAKLALIQVDIPKTQEILVEAQNIAESHNMHAFVQIVSKEHDNLLEQLHLWNSLKKRNAPMSERIKLASLDNLSDLEIKIPELVEEEPVLLLIIAEGGIPVFSNLFTEKFSVEDGFISNFLTAFNTFSETVFSKGLDRAKFGEYILIMDSIGSFKVCYLFKGQSYTAKQKLIQFAHRVQNTPSIWRALEDFNTTHQFIVLTENPALKSSITETFVKKSSGSSTPNSK